MDRDAETALARLVRSARVATLATLREGAPNASLVSVLPDAQARTLWLRLSRLAWHTQDLARDARAALLLAEADDARADPQTLARLTLRGEARPLAAEDPALAELRAAWLTRFPASAVTFELADLGFWRFAVRDARLVAGLARTWNVTPERLWEAVA